MAHDGRIYTAGERFERARLIVKGGRQAAQRGSEDAVDARIENRIDRIDAKAEERYARNASVAIGALEAAENELARAEHALRMARGPEKTAARRARNDAKDKVNRAKTAARKFR
ncbi:hypothetical protein [Streptomyces sp. NPDC002758]